MTNFERGLRAARAGLNKSDCRLKGNAYSEWIHGYDSYVPSETTEVKQESELDKFFRDE